jgi:hypothetical protein
MIARVGGFEHGLRMMEFQIGAERHDGHEGKAK